jgi:hypothetical protein
MNGPEKIEVFQALGNSLLCTTLENRLKVRKYLLDIDLGYISGNLQYDGSGNSFAREIYNALERQSILNPHFGKIIDLAIEIENHGSIVEKLNALQDKHFRSYS